MIIYNESDRKIIMTRHRYLNATEREQSSTDLGMR